jgi:hypothetical protein
MSSAFMYSYIIPIRFELFIDHLDSINIVVNYMLNFLCAYWIDCYFELSWLFCLVFIMLSV